MKDSVFYKIIRPIVSFLFKIVFRPKYEGLENIKKEGALILAGNHTHPLDAPFLMSSTKRGIHFLAKSELWKGPKKIIFSNVGLIPVNRNNNDHAALESAINYLNSNLVIGIHPEGTTEKGRGLLPFKKGAVKMAYETNTVIVPFVISGKYKLFKNNLKITFLKPIKISKDIEKENERLYNIIKKEREKYE